MQSKDARALKLLCRFKFIENHLTGRVEVKMLLGVRVYGRIKNGRTWELKVLIEKIHVDR